ncbi:hypothetical protein F3Y22_tig00111877pilonHSYRG00128 [Hibiscus syriacus]|uniref:NAC domain-containing protein n=1 Tax=Hibiscus syriacus TaxID=106335 RepID=A0A6A2X9J0_HIBSY|nr:hypothetical protein F3Y22_tig00111877pilonHSYRG00128 [Hibiscus syriacus]
MEGDILGLLPPGYKFKPSDEELIDFYLKIKIYNRLLPPNIFRDVDLYKYGPYTLTDRRHPNGKRPVRRTGDGYWRATGKAIPVTSRGEEVGSKRTLVFFRGKSSKEQEEADRGAIVAENEDQVLENGISPDALKTVLMPQQTSSVPFYNQYNDYLLPQYSQSLGTETMPDPLASMPPYHQFQPPVQLPQQFSSAGPRNLNFTASDGFILDVQQEEVNNGAVVANGEVGVMENGIPPDSLNTLMTSPDVSDDFNFTSTATPLASMPPYDQFQPLHFESQVLPPKQQLLSDATEIDGYILDFEQENADDGAVEVNNGAEVLENGIPPPARCQQFDAAAMNMETPQKTD